MSTGGNIPARETRPGKLSTGEGDRAPLNIFSDGDAASNAGDGDRVCANRKARSNMSIWQRHRETYRLACESALQCRSMYVASSEHQSDLTEIGSCHHAVLVLHVFVLLSQIVDHTSTSATISQIPFKFEDLGFL